MSEQTTAPLSYAVVPKTDDLRIVALITLVTVAAILGVYFQTTSSMVSIWNRSETFTHCFLIAPISGWMIWRQRRELIPIDHRPNPWALVLVLGLGFGWLLAALAHVLVFQQYFLVAMIPVAVWAILGSRMTWALAFPLAYLLLAVPFGEVFIPALIDRTADFTVAALLLTGIPVYREGAYFSLPTGNWSVVEACSGLRYLIASITLGTLYAYLTYTSLKRRLAFIALSIIVPIVANWVRAYMIVMLGHLSGMRLAVGADHLVYGWAFFGIVILLLFWMGSFWREDVPLSGAAETNTTPAPGQRASLAATAGVAVGVVALALLWPIYIQYLERHDDVVANTKIDIPGAPGKWNVRSTPLTAWKPVYVGTPTQFSRTYESGARAVGVYVAAYRNQRPGSQVVTSGNMLVSGSDNEWTNTIEQTRVVDLGSAQLTVRENGLRSASKKLLVWRWYRMGTEETTSPQIAKMILAKNKLLGRGDDGAEIIVAAEYEDKPEEAVRVLREFLSDMLPVMRKGLVYAAVH